MSKLEKIYNTNKIEESQTENKFIKKAQQLNKTEEE